MNSSRERFGLFTEIQLFSLYYKSQGYSLREIAEKKNTSHQNISIAYRRALRNREIAEKTLFYYNIATSCIHFVIPASTYLADIPSIVFKRCDEVGVKIKADVTLIFKLIRFKHRDSLEGNRLKKPLIIVVGRDGELNIYSYEKYREDYERIINYLEKINNEG